MHRILGARIGGRVCVCPGVQRNPSWRGAGRLSSSSTGSGYLLRHDDGRDAQAPRQLGKPRQVALQNPVPLRLQALQLASVLAVPSAPALRRGAVPSPPPPVLPPPPPLLL